MSDLSERILEWERYTRPIPGSHEGTPAHQRGTGLAAPTPAARIIELTQLLEQTRMALTGACAELRRHLGSDGD